MSVALSQLVLYFNLCSTLISFVTLGQTLNFFEPHFYP